MTELRKKVTYHFDYGLSYTDFEIKDIKVNEVDNKIKVNATVLNTGKRDGKEVVQVYFSAPQGKLGKPKYELAAFCKTKLLSPGESVELNMVFDIVSMVSYDDTGKIQKSAYVLEKGAYSFYVGNSIRTTMKSELEYVAKEDIVVLQLAPRCVQTELEKRMRADGSFEELSSCVPNVTTTSCKANPAKAPEEKAELLDVYNGKVSIDEFIAQLSDDELVSLTYGKPAVGVSCTCGMAGLEEYGVPCLMTTDGPAGIRAHCVCATCFPCATLQACSWDTELVREINEAGAKEVKENNMAVWLAPGFNIHRNPLCGRNFEYYSEDPLVTGEMATVAVKGIRSQHIAATIKHFCANNTEVKRSVSNSIVSERALREIYLKGFEICVKKAQPWLVMTAYNSINGVKTFENYDLITNILRGEWGYKGAVTTDWGGGVDYKFIKAGNDIRMPAGKHEDVMEALKSGKLAREEVEMCVRRILELVLKID